MNVNFVPMDRWPHADASDRRAWAYKADYLTIIADLTAELGAINASDVEISLTLKPKDIRRDGWPLAGACPFHPGVILTVHAPQGVLQFACDENQRWQHNLRAISLTLEALRAVERHGASKSRQQYAGYLTSSVQTAPDQVQTPQEAAAFLTVHSGENVTAAATGAQVHSAYRAAAQALRMGAGGDEELARRLNQARDILMRGKERA